MAISLMLIKQFAEPRIVFYLLPKYKAVMKQVKPVTKQIQVWSGKYTSPPSCQDADELTEVNKT